MSHQSAFAEILAEGRNDSRDAYLRRALPYQVLPHKAVILTGVRRSGKSTLLRQIEDDERAAGRPCLHMNFVDERLAGLRADELGGLFDAFYQVHPETTARAPLSLLLDELQVVDGWEAFVERQLRIKDRRVFITGSSAKLLGREIASAMRGRSLSYEVFPFDFREFLAWQNRLPARLPLGQEEAAAVKAHFRRYLLEGGFPETVGLDRPTQVRILQEYLDVLLLRDVIERNDASSPVTVRRLLLQLVSRFAGTFTVNRLADLLRAQGLGTAKANVSEMIEWFADAYAIFPVKVLSESVQKQNTNPKKLYVIDNGLINAVTVGRDRNEGRLLENLVFLTLRRRHGEDVHYVRTRSGYEVDFHSSQAGLVQVAWSLADETVRTRELRALEEAMQELRLRESKLITADESETIDLATGTVTVLPAWEWMLSPG
jgi:predicted AAA+ superfamily ATPase